MNVGDLKEAIKDLPDDMGIARLSDDEGNEVHELWRAEVSDAVHVGEYHAHWDLIHEDDLPEYDESELVKVLVLV